MLSSSHTILGVVLGLTLSWNAIAFENVYAKEDTFQGKLIAFLYLKCGSFQRVVRMVKKVGRVAEE